MWQQQQEVMFAAFRKMINIISHKITAGSRRCCPELITDGLFPPQKSHHHFNLLQVQRTERPLIQSLYFAISALHERPEVALGNRTLRLSEKAFNKKASSFEQQAEQLLPVMQCEYLIIWNLYCFLLTRFPCSARISECSSLLWMWCSLLDFNDVGSSVGAGRSCGCEDIDRSVERSVSAGHPSLWRVREPPHLQLQCVQVFGGAAEGSLGDHLHRIEQWVSLSPQRTPHL